MNLALSTDALKTGFSLVSRTLYLMSVYPNLEFVFYPLARNNAKCALLYAFKNKIGLNLKQIMSHFCEKLFLAHPGWQKFVFFSKLLMVRGELATASRYAPREKTSGHRIQRPHYHAIFGSDISPNRFLEQMCVFVFIKSDSIKKG